MNRAGKRTHLDQASPAGCRVATAVLYVRRLRWLLAACVLVLLTTAGGEFYDVLFGRNLHEVIAGRVYRCAQPSGRDLENLVRAYAVRTVINLRGCSPLVSYYLEESRADHSLDLQQEDVFFSAYRLPSAKEVRRLVEILDRAEYPVVLHCRRGSDRTGLAAAIALLLQTDATPEAAQRQLALRFGHVAVGRPASLDGFFDLYRQWLGRTGRPHTRVRFRDWLENHYCGGGGHCTIEPLDVPTRVRKDEIYAARVRVQNTSVQTWHLRAGTTAGVHVGFIVLGDDDSWVKEGRGGLYDAEMKPGDSREFTVLVPPLGTAGHYRLVLDMVDEQNSWFFQAGSEPLQRELEVLD